jgi:peptidoglycan/LPS O-acetylase OafA/YrhL
MSPSWLPGGFVGVDIFFVISGFVVTSSMLDHREVGPFDFVIGFLARRVKRLLPMLLLVCSVTSLALFAVSPFWETKLVPRYLRIGLTGILGNANNWMLFGEQEDYWSQGSTEDFKDFNPFLHLWSLGVEEQFYIIFPFVLLTSKLLCVPFVGILLAMAVSSLVFGFWLSHAVRTSAVLGM